MTKKTGKTCKDCKQYRQHYLHCVFYSRITVGYIFIYQFKKLVKFHIIYSLKCNKTYYILLYTIFQYRNKNTADDESYPPCFIMFIFLFPVHRSTFYTFCLSRRDKGHLVRFCYPFLQVMILLYHLRLKMLLLPQQQPFFQHPHVFLE